MDGVDDGDSVIPPVCVLGDTDGCSVVPAVGTRPLVCALGEDDGAGDTVGAADNVGDEDGASTHPQVEPTSSTDWNSAHSVSVNVAS
jgi:hypothetical protein